MTTINPKDGGELASIADDLLTGAAAIASFLGIEERRAFYLCEKRLIPVGKLGASWVASRAALTQHFRSLTGSSGSFGSAA